MFTTWLTSFFSKFGLDLLMITLLVSLLVGLYVAIRHSAEVEQKQKDQIITLQKQVKEQNDTIGNLHAIIDINDQTITDLNNQIGATKENFNKIDDSLATPEMTKQDRPASPILKSTIEELRKTFQ